MNAGYVYVLAFTNGTVKVGRTQDTGRRLNAHKSDARKFGLTVTGQWLSPLHAEWLRNEEALKKIAADLGGTAHRKEYFGDVDFAAVVSEAKRLLFTPPQESTPVTPPQTSTPAEPFRSLGLDVSAEKQRIAELEAEEEAIICDLLRLYRKGGIGPDRLRRTAGDGATAGQRVFSDLALLMEAQMTYTTVMDKFVSRAGPA